MVEYIDVRPKTPSVNPSLEGNYLLIFLALSSSSWNELGSRYNPAILDILQSNPSNSIVRGPDPPINRVIKLLGYW